MKVQKKVLKVSSTDKVHVDLQLTKNLGNYESLKVSVGFERSVGKDTEDVAFDKTYSAVERQLLKRLQQALITLKGTAK